MFNNVITFPEKGGLFPKRPKQKSIAAADPEPQEEESNKVSSRTLSTTAQNGRLRDQRHEVWRTADAGTRYWRVRLDFHDAISYAQRQGISEGRSHPDIDDFADDDRRSMVAKWRAAFVKQLLTPAWDTASVAWKQNALARGKYEYTGLKPERLKHAIAEDLAFIAAQTADRRRTKMSRRRRSHRRRNRRRIASHARRLKH
jgi:hypothetical protein